MLQLQPLWDQFVAERRYLKNVSPNTVQWYRNAWRAASLPPVAEPTGAVITDAILRMREHGLQASSVNAHLRALNAFFRWMHEAGHSEKLVRVPPLRCDKPLLATLTPTQVDWVLAYRAEGAGVRRTHAMVILMLDTGLRRAEALTLRRDDVLMDDLLLRLKGKGGKHRQVPFSTEGRKTLFRYLSTHTHDLVFPTSNGTAVSKRNATRDIAALLKDAGVTGVRCSPHTLRHTFAVNYIRNGGDPFRLQRILGHSTLLMTLRYVDLQTADLSAVHSKLSLVARR